MKKQTAVKEVTVLNVYKFRKIARICFEVLSSNETDKYTTCFDGSVEKSSCTCRGGDFHNCYHVKQLASRAAKYFDARKPAAPVSSSVAILTPEGISVIDKSEVTAHDILAAQFGAQVRKMERAPSGRLVPMR